jgi:hypothetical protein
VRTGCYWSSGIATCSGAPTPCSQLSVTNCTKVPGCVISTVW